MVTKAESKGTWRTVPVVSSKGQQLTAVIPTREDILNLQVGDVAPYIFGEGVVAEIYARKDDVNGKAFVLYYIEQEFGRMSGSAKEDEMHENIGWKVDWLAVEMDHLRRAAAKAVRE